MVHDAENGYAGFGSLIFNENSSNQFRLVASLRQDYYQIPIDPNPNSAGNAGGAVGSLPWHAFASTNMYYGSGFTNGMPDAQYPGDYLPQHTTFDISLGKSFGEGDKYRLSVTSTNVRNRRVLLDNSLTFGGFHFNDPRQIYGEFRWRFHY